MKLAQTEIIGLAIVVILVILGMAFVTRFKMTEEPAQHKKEFTQAELATNMLNTFLRTTSDDCSEYSMTELLQDCGENPDHFICVGDTVRSCDYVKQEAQKIFDETLGKWNINYEFKVFHEEENPILTLGQVCSGNKKSKTFPVPTNSRTLLVKLDICG